MNLTVVVPIVLRLLGWAKYTPTVLKFLPYVLRYGPAALQLIERGMSAVEAAKAAHPKLFELIARLAAKIFPDLPEDERNEITGMGVFLPRKMSAAQEAKWMERVSDAGPGGG